VFDPELLKKTPLPKPDPAKLINPSLAIRPAVVSEAEELLLKKEALRARGQAFAQRRAEDLDLVKRKLEASHSLLDAKRKRVEEEQEAAKASESKEEQGEDDHEKQLETFQVCPIPARLLDILSFAAGHASRQGHYWVLDMG
jgi:type IV secretory pathway VirB10-like protein